MSDSANFVQVCSCGYEEVDVGQWERTGENPACPMHGKQPEGVTSVSSPGVEKFGSESISYYFGLSYASYLAIPRAVLEAMPGDWQERFTAMLGELCGTFDWERCYPKDFHLQVVMRDGRGRYYDDPLRNYRHPCPIPRVGEDDD